MEKPILALLLCSACITIRPAYAQRDSCQSVNIKSFGAVGDGTHDDYPAIQKAVDWVIRNPSSGAALRFPVGAYRITHPIILQYVVNGKWIFFTIRLYGDAPSKSASNPYLSKIICDFTDGFGIGIQAGRGIQIENLTLMGRYRFPNEINSGNIGTTLYGQWKDGSVTDKPYAPYSGIAIDPFCDSNAIRAADGYAGLRPKYLPGNGQNGTSGVEIRQCAIHQFAVGLVLTPNPVTANDEMINIIDCNIDRVKVAIAIGQDQCKEIHIDRLKVWGGVYTVIDGNHYGRGTGGGSVMLNGANIAGSVNQLFSIITDRFPFSGKDIYAESLYRIGMLTGNAGSNLINCVFDFICLPGIPVPDYYVLGGRINISGGAIRFYNNHPADRINFSTANVNFRDMTMGTAPITVSLYANGLNPFPVPSFENVFISYSKWFGAVIGRNGGFNMPYFQMNNVDPLYHTSFYAWTGSENTRYAVQETRDYEGTAPLGNKRIDIDRKTWTGRFYGGKGISQLLQAGDYLISPSNGKYYDTALNPGKPPTVQVGRVARISGDTVYLDQISLNAYSGAYDLWADFIYYTEDGFIFNCAKGSNSMTAVQSVSRGYGALPLGQRFTTDLFPKSAYVVAVDTVGKTITMSAPALATANDVSLTNGDPEILITSAQPPAFWLKPQHYKLYGLYGGAIYRQGTNRFLIGNTLPCGDTTLHKFSVNSAR